MSKILPLLLTSLLLCACGNALYYSRGPADSEIEGLQGYDGIIRAVDCPSSEKDLTKRRITVYLPRDYYRDTLRRYPVFYLLHGARGNEKTWIDRGDILHRIDSLRRCGLARDFILVLPNLNNYFGDRDYKDGHPLRAMQAFWLQDGEAERYFVHDVVARVDSLFRTEARKSGRAVAGMSNGALQALYLAADYPDLFDYVGLFSPYAYATFAAKYHRDVYGGLSWKLERQFANPPAVYNIYIGKADFFYPHMVLFDRRLTRKGYPHRFVVAEGGHEWYNWTAFCTDFCQTLFQ